MEEKLVVRLKQYGGGESSVFPILFFGGLGV